MFFLALISFTGVGIIAASCRIRQAERFLMEAVYEMESAGGSEDTEARLCDLAEEKGFELEIMTDETDEGALEGSASLTYSYRMPLFGFENSGQITSIIRGGTDEDEGDN